jgi:hypothetical protein
MTGRPIPVARIFKQTENDSPSPWGEGRNEGGREAEERFAPLPIAASRTVNLGGTVATVGFPDIGLQGFAPKLARGEIASLSGAGDDARYFQISAPVQPGKVGVQALEHFNKNCSHTRQTNREHLGRLPWPRLGRWR